MKIIKLVFSFFLFVSFSSAQTISPSVINSAGRSFETYRGGMDINIGEPITGPISNGNFQITQGFLQPIFCDDNNPCTNDELVVGVCIYTPININDNNVCTNDVCNSNSGIISHLNVNIDDGDACTVDNCNSITGITHIALISPSINNNSPICSGSTLNLFSSGGTNYSWIGPNGFSSTQQNPIIPNTTLIYGGNYTVTITSPADKWVQKSSTSLSSRYGAVGFSIGSKGYFGTGSDEIDNYKKDFWEYDPASNSWTQKADFGGIGRFFAVGFSIGNKGYIGTGVAVYELNDFWEYDLISNSWNRKSDFGGSARSVAVGFSIGAKGYIGTGSANGIVKKDLWEFDPSINAWSQKSDFGGVARQFAVGFNIGSKGYIGIGALANNGALQDFWEYDPLSNIWIQKANFGGSARWGAFGFSIASKGYIGAGYDGSYKQDFWEYNLGTNTWSSKANLLGSPRMSAPGFSIANKGYTGTGWFQNNSIKDFWEYEPSNDCSLNLNTNVVINNLPNVNVSSNSPVCFGNSLNLISTGGTNYIWSGPNGFTSFSQDPTISNVSSTNAGNYSVTATDLNGCTASATTNITINQLPTITVNNNSPICVGNTLNLSSSGGTSYSWIGPNGFNSSLQNPVIPNVTLANAGTYNVSVVNSSNAWTLKAQSQPLQGAVGFSIGTKGYIGTGYSNGSTNNFWEYDQGTNTWTQKADFGGTPRYYAVGFSIGSKGYIGTGIDGPLNHNRKDFWEYDPVLNQWNPKNDFGGTSRWGAVGFSIGSKGYIGTGYSGTGIYYQDFWEYDPMLDSWTLKSNFGGIGRYYAVGFSIGFKGYIGTGYDGILNYQDFWEYDQASDSWTQKSNFLGAARHNAVGFSINNRGYIGTGYSGIEKQDFWEYDNVSDTWTQKNNFGGTARYTAVGFSIGSKGYIGTGYDGSGNKPDFWEYDPSGGCSSSSSTTVFINSLPLSTANSNSPICAGASLNLSSSSGTNYSWTGPNNFVSSQQNPVILNAGLINSGNYTVVVTNENGCTSSSTTVVIVNPLPPITVGNNSPICEGNQLNLISGGGISYLWSSSNNFTSTLQNPVIENTTLANAGTYIVTVTDNQNNCSASTSTVVIIYPASVDDNNLCTIDGCDPLIGSTHLAVNINDNDLCTSDACNSSTGIITHIPLNINDNNVCTLDACESTSGNIIHINISTTDNDACTIDICDAIFGVFHIPVSTNDNNPCTIDACDPLNGNISHINVNTDDGNLCTTDGCSTQSGVFHIPVSTNDNNPCTIDGCNSLTGVYHAELNTDDNNACTIDACNSTDGTITHILILIDDGNACTTDACNSVLGIIHNPINTEDNNACTLDICNSNSGIISHFEVNVDDDNVCTTDGCNSLSGIYHLAIILNSSFSIEICQGSSYTLPWGGTVDTEGYYSYNYTTNSGCDSIVTLHLVVNPLPIVSITASGSTTLCNGDSIVLSASNASTYLWSNGAITQIIKTNLPGNYSVTITNAFNCSATSAITTITSISCPITLHLRFFIEGFYMSGDSMRATIDPINFPTLCDLVKIELHNPTPPYARVRFLQGTINTDGWGNFTFPSQVAGHSYYIVIKHRNTIETWSKYPVLFNGSVINFDFTRQ